MRHFYNIRQNIAGALAAAVLSSCLYVLALTRHRLVSTTLLPSPVAKSHSASQARVAVVNNNDAPLILTPYIQSGRVDEALQLSRVAGYETILSSNSYAAYITVKASSNGNLFFWFFRAETNDSDAAPLVLWLNGGPGASSLGGLFNELGPLVVSYDDKSGWQVGAREYRWSKFANLLFIDQPVGTGFSFTDIDDGYARNEDQIGEALYQFFPQFYTLFPQLVRNPLYITGESYAGKYLPALGAAIYQHNVNAAENAGFIVPLEGVAIGDGWMNPAVQVQSYADFFYNIGMMDEREAMQVRALQQQVADLYAQGNYLAASDAAETIINDDYNFPSLFENFTQHQDVYNILYTTYPSSGGVYHAYVARPDVAQQIHVGNVTFGANNGKVGHFLAFDMIADIWPKLSIVMQNYRTMIYNGQLDALCGVTFAQVMLEQMNTTQWPDRDEWFNSQKQIWKVDAADAEVAGYVKQVADRFYQVVVRGSGHMVPTDQPRRAYDLIERFVTRQPYVNVRKR